MAHFYCIFYRISFVVGILLGVLLAVYFKQSVIQKCDFNLKNDNKQKTIPAYEAWFNKQSSIKKSILWDDVRYRNQTIFTESQYLFNKIKVVCIILIKSPKNFIAANETWATGCNSIMPIYLQIQNKIMPAKQPKESSSWVLLCSALNDIKPKDYKWVLVVKDSTFVIMENLRYYVAPFDANKRHYFGHPVKFWGVSYNSADAGYALSSGALKDFQKDVGKNRCKENSYWNREDFYLGKYLANMNITPINTVDNEGLSIFHPYSWYHLFYPGDNYYKTSIYPIKCCSKKSISFDAIESDKIYYFNYLLYKLQIFVYGSRGNIPNRDLLNDDKVWKQFLKEHGVHDNNIGSEQYYKLWENLVNSPDSFAQKLKNEQLFDYD